MTAATEITRTRRRTRVTDSSLRAHVQQAANAGELRLPGRRVRLVSTRRFLLYVIASLLVALPMAAISSVVHGPGDPVSAALSPDPRTPAQRAVDDAQARLLRAPNDPHAMGRLASAYLQRARETGDPTYYSKADALLAVALAAAALDPDLLVTAGSPALSRHDFAAAPDWGGPAGAAAPARPAAPGVGVDGRSGEHT